MTQQQVLWIVRVEGGQVFRVLFLKRFQVKRGHIRYIARHGLERGPRCVNHIERIGRTCGIVLGLEVHHQYASASTPTRTAAKALHQTWPRRQFGNQHTGGDVYASFDHLRRYDNAVNPRAAGGTAQECVAPASAFVWSKAAVNQSHFSVPQRCVGTQCVSNQHSEVNGVDHHERWSCFATPAFPMRRSDLGGKRLRFFGRTCGNCWWQKFKWFGHAGPQRSSASAGGDA